MDENEFSKVFNALHLKYGALREQVAGEIETYAHLVETEGPNIADQHMMLVGRLECQEEELQMEARRWKRRFELRQQYLNRGEKPDLVAIEAMLSGEFAEWHEKIAEAIELIKASKLRYDNGKMSDADTNEIRCAYLKAVKHLHPDLNENLSKAAVSLWHQIQGAYAEKNWAQLKFLTGLVDDAVSGAENFEETPEGLERMRAACARLEDKGREVARQIAAVKATAPFTYLAMLEDPELVRRKQDAIGKRIAALKECIEGFERKWSNG